MTAIPKPAKRDRKAPKPIRRYKRPAYLRVRGGRGKLRKLADDAMSLYVRHRDGWRCQRCGLQIGIQNAHIIAKGPYPAGRYVVENCMALCFSDHRFYTGRPFEWREFVGAERHDELFERFRGTVAKWDYAEQARRFLLLTAKEYPQAEERLSELNRQAERLELWK